jgi:beta-carotene ketolase (CrtO type)
MPEKYDAIVIGSGHNGLTCACYLAKAGLKVLILEQSLTIGGMTNTEEVTLPGFKSDTHAFCVQFANFSPALHELQLDRYDFEMIQPEPCLTHAFPDGRSIFVHRDLEQTCQSIAQYSRRDGETWRKLYKGFLEQLSMIDSSFNSPPATFAEQAAILQKLPDGLAQYRFQMQSLRSWCDEMFEAEETKVLLGTWAVHAGVSPDDAGGGNVAWLFSMIIQHFGNNIVKGGMRNLPLALAAFLKAHDGEIRTNVPVKKVIVERGRAIGVQVSDGEEIECEQLVASNAHPRHLVLELLGESVAGSDVAGKIRRYELGQAVMVIYLALNGLPTYKAGEIAGKSPYVHHSPPSLNYFSEKFHAARSGLLPQAPFALMCNDSAVDPSRVPPGKGLMKLVVQPVPYLIKGDMARKIVGIRWNEVKEPFADRVIDMITRDYIPDFRDRIVKRVVHSPQDIEKLIPSAIQGTNSHGAFLPYQIGAMRPIPELGNYRSPVPNVYLCGSGSHPGPGVTMSPGRNAAQIIYQDLGLDFKESFSAQ